MPDYIPVGWPVNHVTLQGWLDIERVDQIQMDESGELVITAWLHTDQEILGGKHAVRITGNPAKVVMKWIAKRGGQPGLPEVLAQGQLMAWNGVSQILVRRIEFLGASNRFPGELTRHAGRSVRNSAVLQGWLEVANASPMLVVDGKPDLVLHAWLHTDKAVFGGQYSLTLIGHPAQEVSFRTAKNSRQLPDVLVEGMMMSFDGCARVHVTQVEFLADYALEIGQR